MKKIMIYFLIVCSLFLAACSSQQPIQNANGSDTGSENPTIDTEGSDVDFSDPGIDSEGSSEPDYKSLPLPPWLEDNDGIISLNFENVMRADDNGDDDEYTFASLAELQDIMLNRLEIHPLRTELRVFWLTAEDDIESHYRIGCDPRCLWVPVDASGNEYKVQDVTLNPISSSINLVDEKSDFTYVSVHPRSYASYYAPWYNNGYFDEIPPYEPGYDDYKDEFTPDWVDDPATQTVTLESGISAKAYKNEEGKTEYFYSRDENYLVHETESRTKVLIVKKEVCIQYYISDSAYTRNELFGFSVKPMIAGSNCEIVVSQEKASQIQVGMTYKEAVAILGSYGKADVAQSAKNAAVFTWKVEGGKTLVATMLTYIHHADITNLPIHLVLLR